MIWTKEVPVKPGKYIARYKDEDTGRTRYLDVTVGEFGSTPFFRGVPHKYIVIYTEGASILNEQ